MKIVYEAHRFKFEYDPILEKMVRDLAKAGPTTIQALIDECGRAGFDCRAAATEIGIQLMDGVLRPCSATERLAGSTVVEVIPPSEIVSTGNS